MTTIAAALIRELSDEDLDQLADALAGRIASKLERRRELSPYLNVKEAAEYLRCSPQRIYDLHHQGRLAGRKDGARLLIHRDELDGYLNA